MRMGKGGTHGSVLSARLLVTFWLYSRHVSSGLVVPIVTPVDVTTIAVMPWGSSLSITGPSLLTAIQSDSSSVVLPGLEKDQVLRVLDGNTIKLKKNGIVTLAGVRMPTPGSSTFQLPECLSYAPVYKVRQLLPANANVRVKVGSSTSAGRSFQAVVVRSDDDVLVNQELVRSGFGRVQKVVSADLKEYLNMDQLSRLQDRAKQEGIGIFQRCDAQDGGGGGNFEAQFEPLELTMETQWGDDGGKTVVRQKDVEPAMPKNPGDVRGTLEDGKETDSTNGKQDSMGTHSFYSSLSTNICFVHTGCSDFPTYEDAFRWYETYFPLYGDVAKLDRDGDGVPCPGLPHTKVAEKYRMKVPTTNQQS